MPSTTSSSAVASAPISSGNDDLNASIASSSRQLEVEVDADLLFDGDNSEDNEEEEEQEDPQTAAAVACAAATARAAYYYTRTTLDYSSDDDDDDDDDDWDPCATDEEAEGTNAATSSTAANNTFLVGERGPGAALATSQGSRREVESEESEDDEPHSSPAEVAARPIAQPRFRLGAAASPQYVGFILSFG